MFDYLRDPAEITRRSFEIIAAEADLSSIPLGMAAVATRIVHACGMTDAVRDLRFSETAAEIGRDAISTGASIVCDVRMVAAGIMTRRLPAGNSVLVGLESEGAESLAEATGQTRTAAGMECLAESWDGAVVVIGNAPTALFRILELVSGGAPRPALVIGMPVGFVGAAESKAALADNTLGIPYITLLGRRGGSAVAAAAVNALILDRNC